MDKPCDSKLLLPAPIASSIADPRAGGCGGKRTGPPVDWPSLEAVLLALEGPVLSA